MERRMVKTRSQQLRQQVKKESQKVYFRDTPKITSKQVQDTSQSKKVQTNLLNKLSLDLENAREKKDRYRRTDKIKSEGYDEQIKALNKLISNVKAGQIYEKNQIDNYLREVYKFGKDKQKSRESRKKEISKEPKIQAGNIGTGLIEITDTRTGNTTRTQVDLSSGKTIKKSIQKPTDLTPQEVLNNVKKTKEEVKVNEQRLKNLYAEKGLRAGIVDIKTGEVKQSMRNKVNLEDLRTIARLENTIKLQKENIKETNKYLKELKKGIEESKKPKPKDIKDALKVNLAYNVLSPTTPTEQKQILNQFNKPSDFNLLSQKSSSELSKVDSKLLEELAKKRFNTISPYQTAKNRYKEFMDYAQTQEAKGNYGRGTIAKLMSLPSGAFMVASENLIGLWTIIKNPSELKNLNAQAINNYGTQLGKGIQSGDPKSMLEFIDLVSGNGIFVFDNVPKISRVSLSVPNIKILKTFPNQIKNLNQNLNTQVQIIKDLIKKEDNLKVKNELKQDLSTIQKYKTELKENKLSPKLRKDLINYSELLKSQNKQALKTLFEKQYSYKPTLKEIKAKKDFILEVNKLKNKISKFEDKIKSNKLNDLEKQILKSKNKLNKLLLDRIQSKLLQLDNVKSIKKQNEIIKFLTNELKKNKKVIRIEDKLNKLENKLKVKDKVDLDLLKPQDRTKIENFMSKTQKVQSLTLSQLGSLEKQLDNLLKKKYLTKEKKVISTQKTKKELQQLSKKAQEVLKNEKKVDINKILSSSNPKKQIQDRVNNIEKQIVNIRSQMLKSVFLIDDVKNFNLINTPEFTKTLKVLLKDSKLSKSDKIKVLNAEGTIKSLSDRVKQLKKSKPEPKKALNEKQFELRRKEFENKIGKNKPIITSKNNGLTLRMGDLELGIEYIKGNSYKSFKSNKKGQLGGNSAKLKIELKKVPRLQKAPLKKYYENKFAKSFSNNRSFNRYIESFNVQKKLSDKAKRFDKLKQTPIQRRKLKKIQKQIKELEVKQKNEFIKLYKYLVLKDVGVKTQIKKQLQLSNKNLNKLLNDLKDLELKIEKYKVETKIKDVENTIRKTLSKDKKLPKVRDLDYKPKPKPRKLKGQEIKPKKIRSPPLEKLNFKTKIPKGYNLVYDVVFRERRNINKPYNAKTNPRVNKKISLGLPINRALQVLTQSIDTTTAQRVTPIISGVKKIKDVNKKAALLKKFSLAKNKDGKSFKLQEKKKYLIDTKGEKKELSLQKAIKKNLKKSKVSKKTTKKTKKK